MAADVQYPWLLCYNLLEILKVGNFLPNSESAALLPYKLYDLFKFLLCRERLVESLYLSPQFSTCIVNDCGLMKERVRVYESKVKVAIISRNLLSKLHSRVHLRLRLVRRVDGRNALWRGRVIKVSVGRELSLIYDKRELT